MSRITDGQSLIGLTCCLSQETEHDPGLLPLLKLPGSPDPSIRSSGDLAEARDRAVCIIRSLIMERGAVDWRKWVVRVSDDLDDELFVLPFAFVLGKAH